MSFSQFRQIGAYVLPSLVASLLGFAAFLKGYQVFVERSEDALPRLMSAGVVAVELLLAFWLVSGFRARAARLSAIVVFLVFSLVTSYQAISGIRNCGCFGRVSLHPWYALVIDVLAITLLVIWKAEIIYPAPSRSMVFWKSLLAILQFAGVALFFTVVPLAADQRAMSPNTVVRPESWVGQRFPLMEHIEGGSGLDRGSWIVVLYHSGCPACQQMLMAVEQLMRQNGQERRRMRVLAIEVPTSSWMASGSDEAPFSFPCVRLNRDRKWLFQTPIALQLAEGKVQAVTEDIKELHLMLVGNF